MPTMPRDESESKSSKIEFMATLRQSGICMAFKGDGETDITFTAPLSEKLKLLPLTVQDNKVLLITVEVQKNVEQVG